MCTFQSISTPFQQHGHLLVDNNLTLPAECGEAGLSANACNVVETGISMDNPRVIMCTTDGWHWQQHDNEFIWQ